MPDRPDHPDSPDRPVGDGAPIVHLIPGLSIMERRWLSAGLLVVRCPGCGASQLFSTATAPTTFVHADDDCPILARIEAALGKLWAALAPETD